MDTLIDYFTPGELLHIVSIANQHGFLKTEHKRFLIALRMTSPWENGTWQVEQEKKERFIPILGQFFQELEPWQRCGKDVCAHCDRFQALHADFHGTQESPEFKLFMDWFLQGSRTYVASGTPKKSRTEPARPDESCGHSDQIRENRQAFMDSMEEVSIAMQEGKARTARTEVPAALAHEKSPSPVSVASAAQNSPSPVVQEPGAALAALVPEVNLPARLADQAPETAISAAAPASGSRPQDTLPGKDIIRTWDQPLFTLNMQHPAIRTLESLARQDLHMMDDFQLREFTQRFQKLAREFLQGFGSSAEEDAGGDSGPGDLRRIG